MVLRPILVGHEDLFIERLGHKSTDTVFTLGL